MLAIRQMSRYRAATIHLAVSALIAAGTLALMLALWYPPPLFAAMGGTELALLIVGVDVAIGPLITLIIFDTRKKELLFDLATIATLQVMAIGYSVYSMHAGRPVFIAVVVCPGEGCWWSPSICRRTQRAIRHLFRRNLWARATTPTLSLSPV